MLPNVVLNWITKAENDLKIGQDEMATDAPVTDMVCYHMQQCVEKYLKAYLVFHQRPFRRTHDIAELIEECKALDTDFDELYQHQVDNLTIYGIEIRYPDNFYMPTREEAQESIDAALYVRDFVRERFRQAGLQGL